MTRIFNAEHGFKDEYLAGLTMAYGRFLRRVPEASAVMSVDSPAAGRVAVITGGGSGHYPAFAGLVGPGLCDAAVVGEVFTSPSAEQAYRTIRAVDGGAGVLISFGNYSGDVMHFGLAAERARAEGIDVRIVLVTDDVASAPVERALDRRGIAGGFYVYRAAASAARDGRSLDEVERAARHANARTFSFGVAFAGCTFPGRNEPLFQVDPGRIALGLGIHGEPGIDTIDWVPARTLAGVLVAPVLAERPAGADRAHVLLNGLGSTKYEELFVLYGALAPLLESNGVTVVESEVGEFVTSLDMAGCSFTISWLDDELERLLVRPASAPGFRTGGAPLPAVAAPLHGLVTGVQDAGRTGPATPAARSIGRVLEAMADAIRAAEAELGRLDSVAGDGDHGAGMVRGLTAAAAAAHSAGPGAGEALHAAGVAFADAAGGASGALWGAALLAAGRSFSSADDGATGGKPVRNPDVDDLHRALTAAADAVVRLGGARLNDKTLLDVLVPFTNAIAAGGRDTIPHAWQGAIPVAQAAAAATAVLPARRGRAATHGERSIGTPDPGATSLAIALEAGGTALVESCGSPTSLS
jgi:dihydroxyacetone kinase